MKMRGEGQPCKQGKERQGKPSVPGWTSPTLFPYPRR